MSVLCHIKVWSSFSVEPQRWFIIFKATGRLSCDLSLTGAGIYCGRYIFINRDVMHIDCIHTGRGEMTPSLHTSLCFEINTNRWWEQRRTKELIDVASRRVFFDVFALWKGTLKSDKKTCLFFVVRSLVMTRASYDSMITFNGNMLMRLRLTTFV